VPTNKYLNRREAIKLLGAVAGASLLAGLPAKWSKPSVSGATLPAHAQFSGLTIIDGGFTSSVKQKSQGGGITQVSAPRGGVTIAHFVGTHFVQISAPIENIELEVVIKTTNTVNWLAPTPHAPASPEGTYLTEPDGFVRLDLDVMYVADIEFTWGFVHPTDGIDQKTYTLTYKPPGFTG